MFSLRVEFSASAISNSSKYFTFPFFGKRNHTHIPKFKGFPQQAIPGFTGVEAMMKGRGNSDGFFLAS
jgi:hypothetical protein